MKKFIVSFLVIAFNGLFAQSKFVWEKTDSIPKTKSQIYFDTKLFIAEHWKANNVTQLDDLENGVLLIKGNSTQSFFFASFSRIEYIYVYGYTIKFLFKDGKYKIVLNNVYCKSTSCVGNSDGAYIPEPIEPFEDFENIPVTRDLFPKKVVIELMTKLKSDLQKIIDSYETTIKAESLKSDW